MHIGDEHRTIPEITSALQIKARMRELAPLDEGIAPENYLEFAKLIFGSDATIVEDAPSC